VVVTKGVGVRVGVVIGAPGLHSAG
jgi:hypothetical protein